LFSEAEEPKEEKLEKMLEAYDPEKHGAGSEWPDEAVVKPVEEPKVEVSEPIFEVLTPTPAAEPAPEQVAPPVMPPPPVPTIEQGANGSLRFREPPPAEELQPLITDHPAKPKAREKITLSSLGAVRPDPKTIVDVGALSPENRPDIFKPKG
jgi:hypothetical protein